MTEFVSKKVITQQQQNPSNGRGELSVVQPSEPSPFTVNTTSIASYFTFLSDFWEWLTGLVFHYTGRLYDFYGSLCDFEQDFIVYTKTSKNNRIWIILTLVALLCVFLALLYMIIKRLRKNTNVSINSHSYSVYNSEYILKEG